MTKVIISEDCGNSPKNNFVKDLTIALAKGDTKFALNNVTDNILWNFIGGKKFQGKPAFAEKLTEISKDKALELTFHHISTHGISGSVNGEFKLKNGKTFGFCDVFKFNNTKGEKVKEITSYVMKLD